LLELRAKEQLIPKPCVIHGVSNQLLDYGHIACTSSHAQKFISLIFLNQSIRQIIDKVEYRIPIKVVDIRIMPLPNNELEQVKGLQLATHAIIKKENFKP
jgi:uncharacterized protein YlbG (UPF0298 family)